MDLAAKPTESNASAWIKDVTMQSFMADVVQASLKVPVLLYFTASWCGPCKQLGPTLTKLVEKAAGKIHLARVDIDKSPQIAGQFGVQSVPTVFVFSGGQPIDAFQGALPEKQIKEFFAKLHIDLDDDGENALIDAAEDALMNGDLDTALAQFKAVNQMSPENPKAIAGVMKVLTAQENFSEAENILKALPDAMLANSDISAAKAALELSKKAVAGQGKLQESLALLEKNPKDHAARLEVAIGMFALGNVEESMEHLIHIITKDRNWNEEAARKQLVEFFEVLGQTHPLTLQFRRRLSSILFS